MDRKTLGPGALLVAMIALAYFPINWSKYLLDDGMYLLQNPTIRDPAGLRRIFLEPRASPQYYPMVFAGFWVEYRLWKFDLPNYHRVNLALHALNAILVWRASRKSIPSGAWLAGAIFALHPVHVESVAWISERKNVLSAFFYLGSLLAYWRFAPPTGADEEAQGPGRWSWYGLAFVLFLLALGSKTATCSLPAAILLVAWGKRGRLGLTDVGPLLPFFVAGLLACSMTAWMEKSQGTVGPAFDYSPLDRCLIAGRALWFYAGKLAWPSRLMLIYPRWRIDPRVLWQYAYALASLGVVAGLWASRRRIGRWPLVVVLYFAGTLLPTLGFFSFYWMLFSFVADHFQYLASLGLIVPASWAISRLGYSLDRRLAGSGLVAIAGLLSTLGVATYVHTLAFVDQESVWIDTLSKNPDCWLAYNDLGQVYWERREVDRAEASYRAALRLRPDYPEATANMGYVHWARREDLIAESYFLRAIQLNPYDWRPRYPLARIYQSRGQNREAAEQLHVFLLFEPDHQDARMLLSIAESAKHQ